MPTTATNQRHRKMTRELTKRILNPLMLLRAGRSHAHVAVLHHKGRRSGLPYATPVMAEPVDRGLVVPLPYGADVDWLRNVLAAGAATIDLHGRTYCVSDPRVIGAAEALPAVSPSRQRAWGRFGIEDYLRVRADSTRPATG